MKGVVIAAVVVVLATLVLVEPGHATVTCQQAVSSVSPCLQYLTSGSGTPPVACCSGVSGLRQLTQTTEDRRTACQCLMDAANQNQDIKEAAAAGLPTACRVQINVPISRSVDCNKLH
ncbi:non-specific lipid-transfer protein 2-like [Pyrus ussuriensis x Pyrus communis]|uniref:Non-specific lipid-transfer protein n=1 Tax=Pyrus ussuriensis x Pyrus communis TaxID=2448454 RepID=A0A5N5HD05_9ROSA|nr:non-specific lipid-transfer protein 2-like [Pyrus ussuriensis x Pyrus communis]